MGKATLLKPTAQTDVNRHTSKNEQCLSVVATPILCQVRLTKRHEVAAHTVALQCERPEG